MASFVELEGWTIACAGSPAESDWLDIPGPMTVAAALRALGKWSFETPRDFDEETWWFRARLPGAGRLHLDGLATLAEVFVDGTSMLVSDNMYHAHVVELPIGARTLTIRFDPLAKALAQKRPRPRWKTRLASHQQLRWIRTTLVGRMPGWSPPVAPVGPWRRVYVERADVPRPLETERTMEMPARETLSEPRLSEARLSESLISFNTGEIPAFVDSERNQSDERISLTTAELPVVREAEVLTRRLAPGELESMVAIPTTTRSSAMRVRTRIEAGAGIVEVFAELPGVDRATLIVGDHRAEMEVAQGRGHGRVAIPDVRRWWPHTHGAQPRYPARIETTSGTSSGVIGLGPLAFRTIALDTSDKRFALSVNGTPVFCRGAVWTSLDVVTLTATPDEYRRVLGLVKDAGMNMLRVSGTLFYEDDAFYDACDELGILVWQDFMFANMDYPIADAAFRASVEREARSLLERLQNRACIAMFCGGSEVEQQAAMFGAPREIWRSELFASVLPAIVRELRPDVPYWFNSPAGGALPFHVDEGAGHYYGVGAYLRPFDDARRANVKFASECLAFANVPEDDLLPTFLADGQAPFVSAKWKERTSKDNGSGWDFEDVRDHYVARLFGVDPARVRAEDMERYLALGRVASGEAILRTLAEFRRAGSPTMGALIWFLQDLWPGAGWGLLDARGEPKSVYWYAKRAMQPLGLFLLDEGVNGLYVHVRNDAASPVEATLEVALYRDGETRTSGASQLIHVGPRDAIRVAVDALLPTFCDSAHAYRFGPPGHDVVTATLVQGEHPIAETSWLVDFAKPPPCVGLEGTLGANQVTVTTRRFAQAVKIVVPGHVAADNYFDLAPGRTRTIALRPLAAPTARAGATLRGELSALNLRSTVALKS